MKRRAFLKSSAVATATAVFAPNLIAQSTSRRFKTALIGAGWWGRNILAEAIASRRCEIVAICDVDQGQSDVAVTGMESLTADRPRRYADFREMLAWERPDVCIVATPDHWHALPTIEALHIGAHVYVEKPVSHTVKEGRAMVAAARAANRVVQVGTHRRVSPHCVAARQFIREGRVGKIGMVRCFVNYPGTANEIPTLNTAPPKTLDWTFWCGPAPLRNFNKLIHPRGFRNFLDFANGQIGDWGVHWFDLARWILDLGHPQTISSSGGRTIKGAAVNIPSAQTTDASDHQAAIFQFDNDVTMTWEHRYFGGNNAEKTDPRQPVGCYFYGTEGTLHIGWLDGWTFYPSDPDKPPIHRDAQLHMPDQQNIRELFADFLDAIDRKRRPVADIEEGHLSTNLALLAMISMKTGRSISWNAEKYECIGDATATAMLSRAYRRPWVYPT
jgi:predicted dehydrogenase